MKRFAVIDCGTNTFHLLVVGMKEPDQFIEIYRERRYVNLGSEGLEKFSKATMKKAQEALTQFASVLNLFEVKDYRAYATAAFRSASNAESFCVLIQRTLGIKIEIIDGLREAELIYKGVRFAKVLQPGPQLLMDIGGGSVEFIHSDTGRVKWTESFPVGSSILHRQFHQTDPIGSFQIKSLHNYFEDALQPLIAICKDTKFPYLYGCSGTFDVLASLLSSKKEVGLGVMLDVLEVKTFVQKIQSMDLQERIQKANIPEARAEMIVVSCSLINFILDLNPSISDIIVSPYALKEGAIFEMFDAYIALDAHFDK